MKMTNSNITPRLQVEAKRLTEIFPGDHEWFWDDGSQSLLTVLRGEECEGVQEALVHACNTAWDHESASKIDNRLSGLMQKLMGVHKNQTLHTTPLNNHLTLFATYWPWTGGGRVSVRIGVYNATTGENAAGGYAETLKKAFHADQPLYFRAERNAAMPVPTQPAPATKSVSVPSIQATRASLQTISKRAKNHKLPANRPSSAKAKAAPITNPELKSVIDSSAEMIEMLRASRSNAQSSLTGLKHAKGLFQHKGSSSSLLNSFKQKKSGVSTGSFRS
jgi:hypothetical protein